MSKPESESAEERVIEFHMWDCGCILERTPRKFFPHNGGQNQSTLNKLMKDKLAFYKIRFFDQYGDAIVLGEGD